MLRKERIISLLTQEFHPTFIELQDQSSQHAGHAGANPGGESHYDLIIVSGRFKGMSKVQRHQAIYKILESEFKTGLHALSIKAEEG